MYRRDQPTEESILQTLANRLQRLEDMATRRVLPPQYEFLQQLDGDIAVVYPDGTEVEIGSGGVGPAGPPGPTGPTGPPGTGGAASLVLVPDSILGLASLASASLSSTTAGLTGLSVWGFMATGTGDARVELQINGITQLVAQLDVSEKTFPINLPGPILTTSGDTIELVVTNLSDSLANYDVTLFTE